MPAGQTASDIAKRKKLVPRKESFLAAVAGGRVKQGKRTSASVKAPSTTRAETQRAADVVRKRAKLAPVPRKIDASVLGKGATSAERRAFDAAPRSSQLRIISAGSAADKADAASARRAGREASIASATGLPIFRAIGNAALATGASIYHDPLKQTVKAAGSVKDAVRGTAAAPAGAYIIGKELVTEGHSKTGAKLIKGVGEDYSRRYGEAYRGESGALKHAIKRQRKEGSFPEVLDLAPFGKVASASAGISARTVAKAAGNSTTRVAKIARAAGRITQERAPLRVAGGEGAGAVKAQKVHKGLAGATKAAATDATRAAVQRRRLKRAAAGKKSLTGLQSAAKPGEVVRVTNLRERAGMGGSRRRVAEDVGKARRTTQHIVSRELTGRKGPKDHPDASTLRQNFARLDGDAREAVHVSTQLGIPNAEAARRILPARIAHIKASRDAADRTRVADSIDNLPTLERLLANPEVFDHPEIQRVRKVESDRADRMVGGAEGMTAAQKEHAIYAPLAQTLKIVKREGETVKQYTARMADELNVHPAAHEDASAYRRRLTRAVDAARKPAAPSRTALHRRAGEKVGEYTDRLAKELKMERTANETEPAFRTRLTNAAIAARSERMDPARVERVKAETDAEHLARVKAVAELHGLDRPGYRPSVYNQTDDIPIKELGGAATAAAPSPTARRTGVNFEMGRESMDPAHLENSLIKRIRFASNQAARTRILEREGMRFDSQREAEAFAREHNLRSAADHPHDPNAVVIVPAHIGPEGSVPPTGPSRGDHVPTSAHYIVANGVDRELTRQMATPSAVGRGLDRAQGLQSAALLLASTSWIQFQVLADGFSAATAGGLHRVIHNNRIYKQMNDNAREQIDVLIAGHPANDTMLMDADAQMGALSKLIEKTPGYEQFLRGRNPLTVLLKLDAAKSTALRRSAIIQRLAVDARTESLDHELHALQGPQRLLRTAFTKANPGEVVRMLEDHPHIAEAHGRHVAKMMGNFADYTAFERTVLRRIIPFYGFLRYSARLALYTLPIEHPQMAALIANIGRLTADEQKDIVGPDLPYGLSKFYNYDGTKAVDLSRASQVLGQVFGIDKPAQLVGLLPPIANIVANQVAGKPIYKDRAYHVGQSISDARDLTKEDRKNIIEAELLNMLAPVRAYMQTRPEQQTDDALPWAQKPVIGLSAKTRLSLRDQQESGKPGLGAKLFPLAAPLQPDAGREIGKHATERKQAAADKRTALKARQKALATNPTAQAIQRVKDIKEEARQRAEATIPPQVKAALDRINKERAALGMPPLRTGR